MGTVKARYKNDNLELYDSTTGEHVFVAAPVWLSDDFLGDSLDFRWDVVELNLNTAIAVADDIHGGAVDLIIDSDNNEEDAVLHFGDVLGFDVSKKPIIEIRATFTVAPTGVVEAVFGLAGAHAAARDDIALNAWFKLVGGFTLLGETDDGSSDTDDADLGTTLVVNTAYIFRIDMSDLTDIQFYVDDVRVGTTTEFDMTSATGNVQPYISLEKAATTDVATMRVDYVRIWCQR